MAPVFQIRIRIDSAHLDPDRIGNADLDPDPGARKFTKLT
jgi:hypothetical protein